MRLDLYHAECCRIADEQSTSLQDAWQKISTKHPFSRLEQNGVLHALQVLIEINGSDPFFLPFFLSLNPFFK